MSSKFAKPASGFYEGTMMYEVAPGRPPALDSWRGNTVEAVASQLATYLHLINRKSVVQITIVDPTINAVIISLEDHPEQLIKHLQDQADAGDFLDGSTACTINPDDTCEACQ